jgi:hypothetical protein
MEPALRPAATSPLPSSRAELLRRSQATLRRAPQVRLDRPELEALSSRVTRALPSWEWNLPPELRGKGDPSEAAYVFFVQAALNYCYWTLHDGRVEPWRDGARTMVQRTLDLYAGGAFPGLHLPARDVPRALAPQVADMPLAPSRLQALADVSRPEDLRRILASARTASGLRLDVALAARLAACFPSFQDPFLKRAQLFLGMLAGYLESQQVPVQLDLTAYADYAVPQALRHLGVLEYAPALAAAVDGQRLIPAGSADELAIRSATLAACAELASLGGTSDAAVDAWLWTLSQTPSFAASAKPFHLTRTTAY